MFFLSNLAHIIGVSVRDTNAEIMTDPATVTANSLKSRPVIPLRNMMGRNTAARVMVVEIMAKMISSDPFVTCYHRFFTMLDLLVDIFEHHNGIIHHQSCCQYDSQQG